MFNQAAKLTIEMAELLATAIVNKATLNQVNDIRDRAYTHLKEAMTEIWQCGQSQWDSFIGRKEKRKKLDF